ncbi:MAG: hypothetical protein LM601_11905 [Candidatus Verstraetearchaeota archaeon]|jgi:hypothetical protein|nr:hypothetical protein [Candidatus Verstraetearchaeota archaeon]
MQDKANFFLKKQLEIYNEERSHIGRKGREEIKGLILLVLSQHREEMKLTHICGEVNKKSKRKTGIKNIFTHLKKS